MTDKEHFDLLFQKLDSISEQEFITLVDQLEAEGDAPFAIGETEDNKKEETNA